MDPTGVEILNILLNGGISTGLLAVFVWWFLRTQDRREKETQEWKDQFIKDRNERELKMWNDMIGETRRFTEAIDKLGDSQVRCEKAMEQIAVKTDSTNSMMSQMAMRGGKIRGTVE